MDLHGEFKKPSAKFRQAPFWFWNHQLEVENLEWQIDQMQEKGLGGFVMHARHGLITPYLSEEWFDAIRFCCAKARENGMMAWAYDERDWPSGPAGGTVIADSANRLKFLKFNVENVQGPSTLVVPDDGVATYGAAPGQPWKRIEPGERAIPSGDFRIGRVSVFDSPEILWYSSYLNTMDPSACNAFVKSTYDLHEQELGDLKQLGLEGFFTDEPCFGVYPDDLARIPWSSNLPQAFLEAKGYDLMERLPELFGFGEVNRQIRYDYWDVATSLFESAFFKTIEDWCDQRGLQLIGHALGEEPLFYQFRCVGNIFYLLKHMHIPGLDHLTVHIGQDKPEVMSPKIVASAALLAGKNRVLTETFGESGWKLTMPQMKWMADWQIANGINYIIPHAFYYSVAQRRKKDSPPSEFFQSPFWPYYRLFADYTARLTAALTPEPGEEAESAPKLAVLYPMSSVWADFVPQDQPGTCELQQPFLDLCVTLQKMHRDFVIVDENAIAGADVQGPELVVNDVRFQALILPQMTAIQEDSLGVLKKAAGSVHVIAAPGTDLLVLSRKGLDAAKKVSLSGIPGVRVLKDASEGELAAALTPVVPEVIIENAPGILYLHKRKAGKHIYFFTNTTSDTIVTSASIETVGLAELWNPEDGSTAAAPGQRAENGRLVVPLEFAPCQSRLIVVDVEKEPAGPPIITPGPVDRVAICQGPWHFSPENGNFMALTKWTLSMQNNQHVTELRYKTEFMTPELLANMRLIFDGVPGEAYGVPQGARPIMKGETDPVILLDGMPLNDELPWEIDPYFRVLDLKNHCGTGSHQLEVIIKNNGWFPQPPLGEYAWIAGDFQIDPTMPVPCLMPVRGIKTGAWEQQGFPWFSGTGAYYADVYVPDIPAGKRVILNAGNVGDILEVEVNGRTAGTRPWPPYRFDITDLLCKGLNLFVLKVTNSAQNFFEGPKKETASGLLDDVWLEIM